MYLKFMDNKAKLMFILWNCRSGLSEMDDAELWSDWEEEEALQLLQQLDSDSNKHTGNYYFYYYYYYYVFPVNEVILLKLT